jgi:hypothetical protein
MTARHLVDHKPCLGRRITSKAAGTSYKFTRDATSEEGAAGTPGGSNDIEHQLPGDMVVDP